MAQFLNSSTDITINLDEFDDPAKLDKAFCPQLSEEEYEEQTATETQKALKELMSHIQEDPEVYLNVLERRKREQLEEAGPLSYFKVKIMSLMNGGVYPGSKLSAEERTKKVKDLKTGMQKAFEYSQEAKGRKFSKRLAEKRPRSPQADNCSIPVAHVSPRSSRLSVPPPPPPPPLPCPGDARPSRTPLIVLARPPLRDITSQTCSPIPCPSSVGKPKSHITRALGSAVLCASSTSLSSLTGDLNSVNPMKRLRSTRHNRSPGGTPVKRGRHTRQGSATSMASLTYEEPLHVAFMNILEQKFKNVRSPSPVGRFSNGLSPSSANSFSHFTP